MAILKKSVRKRYKDKIEILKEFGIQRKACPRGYFNLENTALDRLVFFHAPKETQYGLQSADGNKNWLNIPYKNWEAFIQIELNKKDDSFAQSFSDGNYGERKHAVFMKEKDGGYYFYGVYEAILTYPQSGICQYLLKSKTLNTEEWTATLQGRRKSVRRALGNAQ